MEDKTKLSLTIVGDGAVKQKLEDYVKELNIQSVVNFVGERNNVSDYIENSDIVVAIGRCILEGIAMKRLAIISGAKDLKEMVIPENLDNAIDANFTGKLQEKEDGTIIPEMETQVASSMAEKLKNLNIEEIETIVNKNYDIIFQKLNILNNSYFVEQKVKKDYNNIMEILLSIINSSIEEKSAMQTELQEQINRLESKSKVQQETINSLNEKNLALTEEIEARKIELNNILSSKRWRYASKIADIGKKKNTK